MFKLIITLAVYSSFLFSKTSFKESVFNHFQNADYLKVIEMTEKLSSSSNHDGYLSYLRGSALLKLSLYEESKTSLFDAFTKKNPEKNLYYQLGQVSFALEQYKEARVYFKRSIKRKYNIAVSLYYIGFSSAKLKDFKTAVRIYSTIEKLPMSKKKDVLQAARMQIADIYYEQVKKKANVFSAIKNHVIPQYEKALDWDDDSILADDIREKIRNIEQRYEIVLYRMRNGRSTSIPRYFLKGSVLFGYEDNVTRVTDAAKDGGDAAAPFTGISLFGRYSFYPNNRFSFSPEVTVSSTKYISDEDDIKIKDDITAEVGGFFAYEHFLFDQAATTSLKLSYSLSMVGSSEDPSYGNTDNYVKVVLSEEFQFFKNNPTVARFSYSSFSSDTEANNYGSSSVILEQLINLNSFSTYLYFSYDLLRYEESDSNNQDSYTLRGDFLFYSFLNYVNLGPYVYFTQKNFEAESRDDTKVIGLGVNINRPIAKKLYLNLDFLNEKESGDTESEYSANKVFASIDYVY